MPTVAFFWGGVPDASQVVRQREHGSFRQTECIPGLSFLARLGFVPRMGLEPGQNCSRVGPEIGFEGLGGWWVRFSDGTHRIRRVRLETLVCVSRC